MLPHGTPHVTVMSALCAAPWHSPCYSDECSMCCPRFANSSRHSEEIVNNSQSVPFKAIIIIIIIIISHVATLPGAWLYMVSTGTGQPGVSML